MKKIGEYTARGIVTEVDTEAGTPQKITLFDGSFKTAYRVREFYIWGSDWGVSAGPDIIGKLSKNDLGITTSFNFMRADDDNQIAWASANGSTDQGGSTPFDNGLVDPDNLIVEDLYVYARTAGTNTRAINYLVIMDKYEITDWQGALTMARDKAQE